MHPVSFHRPDVPECNVNAMGEYQAMLDALRDGFVNGVAAGIPEGPVQRAHHIKAFGYFAEAAMMGICALPASAVLGSPITNPDINQLAQDLRTRQTKSLASGIDVIMADLKESMEASPTTKEGHPYAIVFLLENPCPPRADEPGTEWIMDAQAQRGCLRANEAACVIAIYIRLLGHGAKSHSGSATDVDLNRLTVAAGLAWAGGKGLVAPYIGPDFGFAAITCSLELATDQPLAPAADQPAFRTRGPAWWLGKGFRRSALNGDPFAKREFRQGPHAFETLKRVDTPTTYIDEVRVARVPKQADMFARAQFGDMGKAIQDNAKGGHYARKTAPPPVRSGGGSGRSSCFRMVRPIPLPPARPTRPAMPTTSRGQAIGWASTPPALAVARNGPGIRTTRWATRSSHPTIRPSR